MRRFVQLTLLAVALGLSTGCSFNRAWKQAAALPATPTDLAGRWEGHWRSEVNQHTGRLRCLITRKDDATYQARFHATFWRVFTATYGVPLEVTRTGDTFQLRGEQDLGWLAGGVHSYLGTANLTNFQCTYRSAPDYGVFQLSRAPADGPPSEASH